METTDFYLPDVKLETEHEDSVTGEQGGCVEG